MLGIDVSKETLTCTLLEPGTERTLWQRTVPNSAAGVQQLLARTPPEVSWVAEPTGSHTLSMVKQARAAGRQVLLAQPRKAQYYLRSRQTRAKTDRLDSRGLGLYALSTTLPPYPVKSEAAQHLDQLLQGRRGISEARRSLKQRISELPAAAAPLEKAVAELKRQQQALDRQIAQWVADHPEFAAVERVRQAPGIGLVTAAAAVSRLQDKQFTHPDRFVAYLGLDIKVRESGQRKGQEGLTKEGDAELRRLFFCCAQATLRSPESPFRAQYERERKKGLTSTGALNAVARKMARMCWSIVRHGTDYDPERVYPRKEAQPEPPTTT